MNKYQVVLKNGSSATASAGFFSFLSKFMNANLGLFNKISNAHHIKMEVYFKNQIGKKNKNWKILSWQNNRFLNYGKILSW